MQFGNFDWAKMKNIQKIHRGLYALGLGPLVGKIVLLLTTTGRKSGKKRVTPLQYEEINGLYYLGAARGLKADWVRNIQSNPQVEIRVGTKHFWGCAEVVNDPARFADFMEVRLERHPRRPIHRSPLPRSSGSHHSPHGSLQRFSGDERRKQMESSQPLLQFLHGTNDHERLCFCHFFQLIPAGAPG